MKAYKLSAETGYVNFSRVAFRLAARDCLACYEAYHPAKFSPVKYFLVCRSIELALKGLHLDTRSVDYIKKKIGHNLTRSYDRLDSAHKILASGEVKILEETSRLYDSKVKAFEYIQPGHAANAYSEFPNLEEIHKIAVKLVRYVEKFQKRNP